MMKKHTMNNIGLIGIIALMIAILIACGVESGEGDVTSVPSDSLYAWGDNNSGQLGNGVETIEKTPVKIGDNIWAQVSAGGIDGGGFTVAIDSAGVLYAWGDNNSGQLGSGNTNNQNAPVEVVIETDITKTWAQASAGAKHTAAIDSDGALYAWGNNNEGQLGIGTETVEGNEVLVNKTAPVKVVIATDTTKTWAQVSAGENHTVAIDGDGALYAWGNNHSGQLGTGNNEKKTVPTKIGDKTWKEVSAGYYYTVAIDTGNALYTWGSNSYGQLGSGNTINRNAPVVVTIGTDTTKTWKQVSVGYYHTIAIDSANHLYAWGYNYDGQLGNNSNTIYITTPVAIEPTKTWKQVSGGSSHTVAIDTGGALYTWGYNYYGQLGNGESGSSGKSVIPIKIGTQQWDFVDAGYGATLGIIQ